MTRTPDEILIYHITDLVNLPGIVAVAGLHSDVAMAASQPEVIGFSHIKERRAKKIRVDCCEGRFVGEFVPFYFCPRSPMLYTVNKGCTGRPEGCQSTIVHLVSRVGPAVRSAKDWAISDGNAGAFHTCFHKDLRHLNRLDWQAIRATSWQGMTHQKSAEFLVADFFPWEAFHIIGCHNMKTAAKAAEILDAAAHRPVISIEPNWYY